MTFLSSLSCFVVNLVFLKKKSQILFSSVLESHFFHQRKKNYCGKMHIIEVLPFKYFKVYPSS